ncbi:MAG: ribbon-helix-helix protein, CopG family [Verrucomicrobiota bacterium]
MKTITVNVSEPVYEEFQSHAAKVDRKTSELIREAMEEYREQHMSRRTSLLDRRPVSVGGAIDPLTDEDDILGEMLDGKVAE